MPFPQNMARVFLQRIPPFVFCINVSSQCTSDVVQMGYFITDDGTTSVRDRGASTTLARQKLP